MIAAPKVEILPASGDSKIARMLKDRPEELHRPQIESAVLRIAPRKVHEGIVRIARRRGIHRADRWVSRVDLLEKSPVSPIDQEDVAVPSAEHCKQAQFTVALVNDRVGISTDLRL